MTHELRPGKIAYIIRLSIDAPNWDDPASLIPRKEVVPVIVNWMDRWHVSVLDGETERVCHPSQVYATEEEAMRRENP